MPRTSPAKRSRLHGLRLPAARAALAGLAGIGFAAHAADFAPAGAKAVVTVDYIYETSGKATRDASYEWRVKRTANVAADLAAQPPTAMPTVQPMDSGQRAQLEGQGRKAQAVTAQMAPMHLEVQKLVARCGEDEACISREVQKMGAAMAADPKRMAAIEKTKKDARDLGAPGALRYQAWRATGQRGTYLIDETMRISSPDPICYNRPAHRCTRDETRKGSGDIPALMEESRGRKLPVAGPSAVEVDATKGTLTLVLPAPSTQLPYIETIKTDEPAGTHDTPTPKGPQQRLRFYRVSAQGSSGFMHDRPLVVALKGGWRSQEGEYAVQLQGGFGDAGTLRVRWRFKVL